jgi:folate-binding protein YgfZ
MCLACRVNSQGSPPFYFDLSKRGRLRVTGEDRVRFLNGKATNDVARLETNRGCYTAFVNAKGRMRSDGVILNTGAALWIDLEAGMADRVRAEMEKYIIADDVIVEDLSAHLQAGRIAGESAERLIKSLLPPADYSSLPKEHYQVLPFLESEGFLFRSFSAPVPSFDFWLPAPEHPAIQLKIDQLAEEGQLQIGGEVDLERFRIAALIPRFGIEMDETTLPPEAGIEARAISYAKGCYLGQEVIARIKSIGHVNRVLARLRLEGAPKTGVELVHAGRQVGKLGGCIPSPDDPNCSIGLAIIRREASEPGSLLEFPGGRALVETIHPEKSE